LSPHGARRRAVCRMGSQQRRPRRAADQYHPLPAVPARQGRQFGWSTKKARPRADGRQCPFTRQKIGRYGAAAPQADGRLRPHPHRPAAALPPQRLFPPLIRGRYGDPMIGRLQALFAVKFNPFSPDLPAEAIYSPPRVDSFLKRVEYHVREGGFAMITGAPGMGKSVTLRLLDAQLSRMRDVKVRSLTHPQSGVADFYRELGHCFAVPLSPHNRWNGFRQLRETWQAFIDSTLVRPVLFIDE